MDNLSVDYINDLHIKLGSIKKVAEYLGITYYKLNKIRKDLGMNGKYTNIARKKPLFSRDEMLNLFDKYGSWSKVAKIKEVNINTLYSYVEKYEIKTYKSHTLNEKYFDIIDTDLKAYFLGFLSADGNINNSRKSLILNISIQYKDKYILEKFLQELEADYEIKVYHEGYASLFIGNNYLCKTLSKYNVVPKKSSIYEPKNIPKEFIPAFIKGFFDGDGCISGVRVDDEGKYDINKYKCRITGNKNSMRTFKEYLKDLNIDSNFRKLKDGKSYEIYEVAIFKNDDIYKFAKIYKSVDFGIKRKLKRFDNFIKGYMLYLFTVDSGKSK